MQEILRNPEIDLVVSDELTYPFKYGWLNMDRPFMQHVVITGRAAPEALCEATDTVTEMRGQACISSWDNGAKGDQSVITRNCLNLQRLPEQRHLNNTAFNLESSVERARVFGYQVGWQGVKRRMVTPCNDEQLPDDLKTI